MLFFPRRKPLTLRVALLRALVTPVCALAGFGIGAVALNTFDVPLFAVIRDVPSADAPSADAPAPAVPVSRAEQLVRDNDCWTGSDDAPADVADITPGHAVVTWPGEAEASLGGERAVSAALEHVFESRHPQLRVHAFCR